MIEQVFLLLWGLWLLMLLIAAFRVFAFPFAQRRQEKRWGDGSANQKPAAVILAAKGFHLKATPRFFDALFSQDYSNYRVIVCFESWTDPVAKWLKDELEVSRSNPVWTHPESNVGLRSITLVCADLSLDEGQKVHNQRAAFEHLNEDDEIIAFADADISLCKNWLPRLLAPINQETHPLATTYRWLIPKRPTLPNQVASVINGSVTTQGGSELTNVLWGGSMAIKRQTFDELDVPSLLAGSLNDDLRLSKAAKKAGNKVAFVRSLVVPTSIDFTWKTFFEFAKRQYTQVKFFSPILYTGTNVVIGFYIIGLLSLIGALIYGYFYAWIPIAAAYIIDQFRALTRQQIYLSLFEDDNIRRKLFAASWLEHMLTPFWMLIHWIILVSTWTQNTITWAGIKYRILSISKTRILDRPAVEDLTLPVGVPGLALVSSLHDRNRGTYTQPIRPLRTGPIQPAGEVTATETPKTEPVAPVTTREETAPETATTAETPTEEAAAEITTSPEVDEESTLESTGVTAATIATERTVTLADSAVSPAITPLSSPKVCTRPRKKTWVRKSRIRQRKLNPIVPRPLGSRTPTKPTGEAPRYGVEPKTRLAAVAAVAAFQKSSVRPTGEASASETRDHEDTLFLSLDTQGLAPMIDPLLEAQYPSMSRRIDSILFIERPRGPRKSRLEAILTKTRISSPSLSRSPSPSRTTPSVSESGPNQRSAPPSEETSSSTIAIGTAPLTHSFAARRAVGSRRSRLVGSTSRKSARSSRSNHVSRNTRGSRQMRPVNRRPSGRSR